MKACVVASNLDYRVAAAGRVPYRAWTTKKCPSKCSSKTHICAHNIKCIECKISPPPPPLGSHGAALKGCMQSDPLLCIPRVLVKHQAPRAVALVASLRTQSPVLVVGLGTCPLHSNCPVRGSNQRYLPTSMCKSHSPQ